MSEKALKSEIKISIMRKSNRFYLSIVAIVLLLVLGAGTAFAYSGSYTLVMRYSVTGSREHALVANEAVTLSGCGTTYTYGAGMTTDYRRYEVGIKRNGSLIVWGSGEQTADGSEWHKDYAANRIIAGNYVISARVTNSVEYLEVHVDGRITQ